MANEEAKLAIINKRWRVWYKDSSFTMYKWVVQRRTWYGRWKTVGKFFNEYQALRTKELLIREDLETFRGDLSEL